VVALGVAAGGLWLSFYGAWTALQPFGEHGQTIFADTAYLVPLAGATVLAAVAARIGPPSQRGFWVLLGVSNAFWLAGESLWSIRELSFGDVPFPWWTDVLYLCSYAPLAAALLYAFKPTMRTLDSERLLDCLLVAGSLALAWWALVLRPLEFSLDLGAIVGLGYPVMGGLMLVLITATRVLPSRRGSTPLQLVGLGVVFMALTDGVYTAGAVTNSYVSGDWISLGWQAEAVMFCLGAGFAAARVGNTATSSRFRYADDVTTSLVVSLAVGVALVTAFAASMHGDGSTFLYASTAALALAAIARVWTALTSRSRATSLTDAATGTFEGVYHDDQLCRLVARARAFDEPFTLAHVAIDRDSGRASIVDEVARQVAGEARAVDSVSRIGPDRLGVLLPRTERQTALEVLERMRSAVAHDAGGRGPVSLTVSIGAAQWEPGDGPDELAARAEAALHAAGRLGGNQIRTAPDDEKLSAAGELSGEMFDLVCELSHLADTREGSEEPTHARAVAGLAREVALRIGLPEDAVGRTYLAALLHDVGKIAISDRILSKVGALEPEEWREVAAHVDYGVYVLSRIPALAPVAAIVAAHHERWDGSGYPHGLAGAATPTEARIVAIADTFVSMLSERPHRSARSKTSALTAIWRESGAGFDPELVRAFLLVAGEHEFDLPALAAEFETVAV
jgi:two-component system cell cycle response regulator